MMFRPRRVFGGRRLQLLLLDIIILGLLALAFFMLDIAFRQVLSPSDLLLSRIIMATVWCITLIYVVVESIVVGR